MVTLQQIKLFALQSKLMVISTNVDDLIHMVERNQPCTQILCQIKTIQKQLQELKSSLFIRQINTSICIIQNNSEVSVQLRELAKLRELFGEKI